MTVAPAGDLSADEIRRRINTAQHGVGRRSSMGALPIAPGVRGDHDLNPDLKLELPLTPAAVLVPLVLRPEGTTVLLTQRTDHLNAHAGQIAFPGGRLDPEDKDAAAAALRETEEEIGLSRAHVEIVGRLDTYVVRTRFEVTPVIGLVTPPFILSLHDFEVAEVFEVPLSFILDPRNHQRGTRLDEKGNQRRFWSIPYQGHNVWGATAGMLVNLYEILQSVDAGMLPR
jgi:8-oxo-dGTP pyrophosphatase MutT (NUDIX family)